ncbi:MAG: class I SAM-dependent methyltransferase, partial [Treponema sp.]|nr:class I SAM-dependent methyltransferase [Treponema sp.]
MDKNIKIVKKHFLDEIYIKEMLDRNINGLQDWERIVVNKYFKNKNSKILNIGCGTGREAMVLAKHGFDITGIDISEKEINIAKEEAIKENLYIEYKLCNGLDLEFENNLFDYSIMWAQTLGNIYTKKNRLKILMENKRILKQNGILSFSTHDYDFVK